MTDSILFIVQLIGVIAFAISGAMVAIDKKMDIFGVCILGVVTAVGGGAIRDVVLGITPPLVFVNPVFALVAIFVSVIIFLKPVRSFLQKEAKIFDVVLTCMDSLGLSIFCVVGIQIAYSVSTDYTVFFLCFVGLISGTGGGILRDVFAEQTPAIFVKHFYACAGLIGSFISSVLWEIIGASLSMAIGVLIIMVLRLLAAYFRWSLPRA